MGRLKVYLSGATRNVSDQFNSWRTKCLKTTEISELDFIDPLFYFDYTKKQPISDKQCLDLYMWQIEQCDVLLLNMDNTDKSIGTAIEVEHAFCNGKPIIGFGKDSDTWYNWIKERTTIIFRDEFAAIDYIRSSYAETVQ